MFQCSFSFVLDDVIGTHLLSVQCRSGIPVVDHPLSIVQSSFLESFCIFTKSNYCVLLPVKDNLEMYRETKQITLTKDMVEMHKIM